MTRRDGPKLAVSLADIRPQLLRLERRGVLRDLSLGALMMLTGCDLRDRRRRGQGALGDVPLQRPHPGVLVQSQPPCTDVRCRPDHAAFPL